MVDIHWKNDDMQTLTETLLGWLCRLWNSVLFAFGLFGTCAIAELWLGVFTTDLPIRSCI